MFGSNASQVSNDAVYVEDVFSTSLYTGNGSTQTINNGIALGSTLASSLQGLPITAISFRSIYLYTLPYINDGQAPNNNTNVAYSDTTFDVYVTFPSAVTLTAYQLAPQGNVNTPYNTPTGFVVLASNDASSWTTVATFTSITTGYPAWDPGTYRTFSFSNTTAYKYWRLQCTGSGSGSAGNSIAEWRVTGTTSVVGNGGLVWIKDRTTAYQNMWFTTALGVAALSSSNTNGLGGFASSDNLGSYTSSGFSLLSTAVRSNNLNDKYVSWTFRKQPKFFDVVTAQSNAFGVVTFNHSLGSVPGCVIVKCVGATENWYVYHRSITNPNDNYLILNSTAAPTNFGGAWTAMTSTQVTFEACQNFPNVTYVAYIFAHDAGGFGTAGTDNVISCGSFTTDGSGNATVSLGYEPQWLLAKRTNSTGDWMMLDAMRGWTVVNPDYELYANSSAAEGTANRGSPTATGFTNTLFASATYIYIAIRRGPMRTPTTGTSVFEPIARAGTGSDMNVQTPYGFPADMVLTRQKANVQSMGLFDRLRGRLITLFTDSTLAEGSNTGSISFDASSGFNVGSDTGGNICNQAGYEYIQETFRRAPGFMDVVCYTGTGSASTVAHNLGVTPELMIVKRRNSAGAWSVYAAPLGNTKVTFFDTAATINGFGYWNNTSPTSSVFTVNTNADVNASGGTYVAYLFASCPGVSKVGSYSGTGSTQTVSCGFAARFVLIKRTDNSVGNTANWWVWDTARGMVAGTDPRLPLNSNATETNANWVYTNASGFQIVTTDATVNASGGTYIYLAIA